MKKDLFLMTADCHPLKVWEILRTLRIRKKRVILVEKGPNAVAYPRDHYHAQVLMEIFERGNFRDDAWEEVCRLLNPPLEEVPVPSEFLGTLLPEQLEDAKRIIQQGKMLVAWDVGCGKTPLSIYCSLVWKAQGKASKCLIVCPAAFRRDVWGSQLRQFTSAEYAIAEGEAEERLAAYNGDAFFVVCSYEALLRDKQHMKHFDCFILDESGRLKNNNTQLYRALSEIKECPDHALLLNGTPVENSEQDLSSQLQWLYGRSFHGKFLKHLVGLHNPEGRAQAVGTYLREYMISRRKTDFDESHAPVRYHTLKLKMSKTQDKARETLLESRQHTFSKMTQEQQITDALVGLSPKLEALKRLHAKPGRKMLYFTQFMTLAHQLTKLLPNTLAFVGGMTPKQREKVLKAFRDDPKIKGLVITTAGARGLNLPHVDCIVRIDSLYNPAVMQQVAGRGDRLFGRTRPLFILDLVVEDTIEETKVKVLTRKTTVSKTMLRDTYSRRDQ